MVRFLLTHPELNDDIKFEKPNLDEIENQKEK